MAGIGGKDDMNSTDFWKCIKCGETFDKKPDDEEHQSDVDFNGISYVPIMCDGKVEWVSYSGNDDIDYKISITGEGW